MKVWTRAPAADIDLGADALIDGSAVFEVEREPKPSFHRKWATREHVSKGSSCYCDGEIPAGTHHSSYFDADRRMGA
jgi:hypothetical protein